MSEITLQQAFNGQYPLPKTSLDAVTAMAEVIPETQHALFLIKLDSRNNIVGARLTPDYAIEGMNDLYEMIGKEKKNAPHPKERSINYDLGDEIGGLINNGTIASGADRTQSFTNPLYANNPDYLGTYLLTTAAKMPDLGFLDSERISRILKTIPKGTEDAFVVNFVKDTNGKPQMDSVAISPSVLSKVTGIPLPLHHGIMQLQAEELQRLRPDRQLSA